MAYESKKKLRKVWFDAPPRPVGKKFTDVDVKVTGGGMAWPEAWKNLCPPSLSRWEDVCSAMSYWKYGKVYGPFS